MTETKNEVPGLQLVEGWFRGTGQHSTLACKPRQAGNNKVGSASLVMLRNSLKTAGPLALRTT